MVSCTGRVERNRAFDDQAGRNIGPGDGDSEFDISDGTGDYIGCPDRTARRAMHAFFPGID